jgi:hypothetical protein
MLFMIAGSSGRIEAVSARDHGLRPLCPKLRLMHTRTKRPGWSRQGSIGRAITAGQRPRRPPTPPRPLRTILTSSELPENGQTNFLKFLALRYSDSNAPSMSFGPGCPSPSRGIQALDPSELCYVSDC